MQWSHQISYHSNCARLCGKQVHVLLCWSYLQSLQGSFPFAFMNNVLGLQVVTSICLMKRTSTSMLLTLLEGSAAEALVFEPLY